MVQRKYIKIKILFFFTVIFYPLISQAISWLPNEGEYKFSSTVLFVDKESKKLQKWRSERLFYVRKIINVLRQKQDLTKYEKRVLQFFESIYEDCQAFNDNFFVSNELEYAFSQSQSFGLKINLLEDKTQYHKYKNEPRKPLGEHFEKNLVKEVGFYYKHSLYKDEEWQVSLIPEFSYSENKIFTKTLSSNIASYIGYTKETRSGRNIFFEVGVTIGKIFNQGYKDMSVRKFSFSEGWELTKDLSVTKYFEYSFADNQNVIYRDVLYEQISLAKKFMSNTKNRSIFTAQIGYYWKRSLNVQAFQVSGPVLSVCINF